MGAGKNRKKTYFKYISPFQIFPDGPTMLSVLRRILSCAASNCNCRLNYSPVGTRTLLDEIAAIDRKASNEFHSKMT